jgi:hypothetical protein
VLGKQGGSLFKEEQNNGTFELPLGDLTSDTVGSFKCLISFWDLSPAGWGGEVVVSMSFLKGTTKGLGIVVEGAQILELEFCLYLNFSLVGKTLNLSPCVLFVCAGSGECSYVCVCVCVCMCVYMSPVM